MTSPADVIAEAERWIGYKEDWDGEHVFSPDGGFGPESQWCGLACEYWFRHTGMAPGGPSIPRLYYTPSAASDFQALGQWTWEPEPGDCALFVWEGTGLGSPTGLIDHIGLVVDTSAWSDGYVGTIEGNIVVTDVPQVGAFTRHKSVIAGFGRPLWTSTPAPDPTIPDAIIERGDDMVIIRADSGWYSVIGGRLIPILGGQQFTLLSKENVAQVKVSEAQLAAIKAAFA